MITDLDKMSYEEVVERTCEHFSQAVEIAYRSSLEIIKGRCPTNEEGKVVTEKLEVGCTSMLDYLLGTAVGVVCRYYSAEPAMEEIVTEQIRAKFDYIRKQAAAAR